MSILNKNYRMKNPLDALTKRLFLYFGKEAHEYYKFPGKFLSLCGNEYPNANGTIPRADVVYLAEMEDGTKFIMNVEDESGNFGKREFEKIHNYKTNIEYIFNLPVCSGIITSKALNECLSIQRYSQSEIFIPFMCPSVREDACEILNILENK